MFLDKSLTLCEDAAIGTSDGYIGDSLDFGDDLPAMFAAGKPMALFIGARTAFAGSSTPTASFQLRMGSGVSSGNINAGAVDAPANRGVLGDLVGKGSLMVFLPAGRLHPRLHPPLHAALLR